jgi:hypothetical protein
MRISHEIRGSSQLANDGADGELAQDAAVELGLRQKAAEFRAAGGEVYLPAH